jgi:hypothetical protein
MQPTARVLNSAALGAVAIMICGAAVASAPWTDTRKTAITDPQYQMTAFTMDAPSSWKFAGTIARDPGCHASSFGLKFSLQSPDGSTAISVLPGMTWAWTTSLSLKKIMEQSHCPGVDIDSAAAFLVNIAVPNTGQVIEAGNQYNHQWISSDGSTLIQTDDHSFNPNGVVYPVSQSWTELVPK